MSESNQTRPHDDISNQWVHILTRKMEGLEIELKGLQRDIRDEMKSIQHEIHSLRIGMREEQKREHDHLKQQINTLELKVQRLEVQQVERTAQYLQEFREAQGERSQMAQKLFDITTKLAGLAALFGLLLDKFLN